MRFFRLALAGVILVVILQNRELALQRRDLKLTRIEIKGQKQQLPDKRFNLKVNGGSSNSRTRP